MGGSWCGVWRLCVLGDLLVFRLVLVMARNAKLVLRDPPDDDVLAPGEAYFVRRDDREGPDALLHSCPCGCGSRSLIWFRGRSGGLGRPEWDVVGAWPNVTLTPSIGITFDSRGLAPLGGGFHWHGYLRSGVFEEC